MKTCDVVVIGAGIAGTTAALAAADAGARVTLVSSAAIFSGSSFFGGTWGLGLVGPQDSSDEDDLIETILSIGRGVAHRPLVEQFVRNINPAIEHLEQRGVILKRAQAVKQKEYIPCFDHKQRSWYGLGRAPYRKATAAALKTRAVEFLAHHELIDLVQDENGISGVVLFDAQHKTFRTLAAAAVVLATGGFGGLFGRTLTTHDVAGTAQALALTHGARLINCEFMQIMPGLTSPKANVVFNEKSFRFAQLTGHASAQLNNLMESRAEHGPFSASLPDHLIDLACAREKDGAELSYQLPEVLPEFMQSYADWFYERFHTSPFEQVRVAPYAHAANGGIYIDSTAATDLPGLFACGEATGGMHGADRLGGLSSANCLVFGEIAGRSAAHYAAGTTSRSVPSTSGNIPTQAIEPRTSKAYLKRIRELMDAHCLLKREEKGLQETQTQLEEMYTTIDRLAKSSTDLSACALTAHVKLACLSAQALAYAMRARPESRGSHFRLDAPAPDPAFARPQLLMLKNGHITSEALRQ